MISNKIREKEFFMELVYLWVEDYKNIQKQGFNFSPRFRCDYDEKTEKLEIIDKDVTGEFYPKNFFGDNINVTAIVGENGSGKSSILEKINFYLTSDNRKILIYKDIKFYILYFVFSKGK
jgi:AAA15 family ATPase/GTPase